MWSVINLKLCLHYTSQEVLYSMFPDDVTTFIDEMGIDIPDLIICDYIL